MGTGMYYRPVREAKRAVPQRPRPELIGDCLAKLVGRLDVEGMRRLGEYRQAWDQVVPGELRPHTRVVGLRNRVLCVEVDGAAERYLLQVSLGSGLLAGLNACTSGRSLQDLRFVLTGNDGREESSKETHDAHDF